MTQIDLEDYIAEKKRESKKNDQYVGDPNLIYKEEKERSIWADDYFSDLMDSHFHGEDM